MMLATIGILGLLAAVMIIALAVILAPKMADPQILGPMDTAMPLQAAAVTKTASFNSAGLDLGSGYAPGANGQPCQAAIPISALDFTTGDETYSFKLQDSPDDSTYTDIGAAVSALSANVGSSIVLNGTIKQRYVRLALTEAGTTPSLTYGPVYLRPRDIL